MTADDVPTAAIEPDALRLLLQTGEPTVVIDVRSAVEFGAGHIEGAINIPADSLGTRASELPRDARIVTVCNHGGPRSRGAADQLRSLGLESAAPLRGGMHGWRDNT